MIRTLIVEDVPLARSRLVRMLSVHADVELVGEAPDLAQTTDLLIAEHPDLVFLDVTLPDGHSPDLLRDMKPSDRPWVVFLTARADHARCAFDVEALDYLLKPVSDSDLNRALDRVRSRMAEPRGEGPSERIPVKTGRRTELVALEVIDYVEAAGHYLCLHQDGQVHVLRGSLSAFAERYASQGLVRVHRSALVRPNAVVSLEERRSGDANLRLRSGKTVRMSRSYRRSLEQAMKDICPTRDA